MSDSNPFDGSSLNSLKAVTDTVRNIMSAGTSVPEDYNDHINAAVSEFETASPKTHEDQMKIIRKHFDAASKGQPQDTAKQMAFQKEVGKLLSQNAAKKRWENH